MSRVVIELVEDVEDGVTGDPVWAAGQRVSVDPISARHYLKTGVAKLYVEPVVVEDAAIDDEVPAEVREQLDQLDEQLAAAEVTPEVTDSVVDVPPSGEAAE